MNRALMKLIRGVIAACVLCIFGFIAYELLLTVDLCFRAYVLCREMMTVVYSNPDLCHFPWHCVCGVCVAAITLCVGLFLAYKIYNLDKS